MDGERTTRGRAGPAAPRLATRALRPSGGAAAPRWRALLVSVAVGAALAVALPGAGDRAFAQDTRTVQLVTPKRTASVTVPAGKSQDIRTDAAFVDITVGDPDIADVNPLTDHTLSILGKKVGTTRVSVYGEGKKLTGVFDVEVSYDTSALAAELGRRFPAAKLRVSTVNGRIMLGGSVPDALALDQALSIARQFGPEVINAVQVASPQQVMLEVRFVEASRSAGRDLGVQWNVFGNRAVANVGSQTPASRLPITGTGYNPNYKNPAEGNLTGGTNSTDILRSSVVAAGVLSGAPPFGFLVGQFLANGTKIEAMLNAFEERGLLRRLAEPNLVALSGDTANFLAGGEYPIPMISALGAPSVEFKKYGVGLAFTPTVLNSSIINLKIEPEVSQIDHANSVTISGVTIPALTVRRASTTLELRDGQSFVLAGLLQNDSRTVQDQLPWLGDVPVLGALFSSKSYQKNETDLVIIVTPRLVRPARPGDPIRTPLDNTLPANDPDFFLGGKPELNRGPAVRGETAALRPFTGHMLELAPGGPDAVQ